MPGSSFAYKLFFLLHIASIVVAFAPAVSEPLFFAWSKREGSLQRGAQHLFANSRRIHFPALVAAGLFGILLVLTSPGDIWEFSQAWVSLAFLVWIGLCGVVSGMIMPGERKLGEGDAAAEKKVTLGGQIAVVLFFVMLYLMIWKPGL